LLCRARWRAVAFLFSKVWELRGLWLSTNELQQAPSVGGMRSGLVLLALALVLQISMHYHSLLATILGPVHDGNNH